MLTTAVLLPAFTYMMQYNATALGYATKSGSACVVKALVDASADIEAKTFGQGVTPLMMLFVSGQHGFLKLGSQDARKIFNYFMEAKANVNAMDKWHATSLMHASHQNNGSEYVQGMIAAGANVNAIADVEGGSHGGGLHPRTALAWYGQREKRGGLRGCVRGAVGA